MRHQTNLAQLACFLGPLGSDGCSDITDFACHCKKGTELLGTVQPCTKKACSEADQKATIQAVETTCKGAGVPIEIPDDTPASSAVVTSVVTATPSATVVTSIQTVTPSSALLSSLSEAISSALSSASSVASASASASHSASHSGSHSGSASSTPTATTSEFTAGAAQATQAIGLMGAAAIALLAL
jgi:hypothetical protein